MLQHQYDVPDEVRPQVQTFAEAMELKLSANDHKGQWKSYGSESAVEWFFARMLEEVDELRAAIDDGEDPVAVLFEAADVANYAMMIADTVAQEAESTDE